MTTATITTVTVKYPSKEAKDFGYGLKINVLLVDANNQEIRLWGKPNDTAISNLRKGQSVQVLFDGKSHKLIETANATQPVDKPVDTGWNPDKKRAIAQSISQNADMLAYCLQTAKSKFLDTALIESEESLRSLAVTLFIQAQKSI